MMPLLPTENSLNKKWLTPLTTSISSTTDLSKSPPSLLNSKMKDVMPLLSSLPDAENTMKPSPPSISSNKTFPTGKPLVCQFLLLRSRTWVHSTSSPLIPISSNNKPSLTSSPSLNKMTTWMREELLLKKSVTITLITTETPKFLNNIPPTETIPRPPSSVNSWSDSMSSLSISKLPWMTLSKLRSEPVEILLLSSKNLRKRPTSSKSNSTDTPLMPPNLRTISSSPKTWKL